MTDADLLSAIQADATATALANAGNDVDCAARVAKLLGPVPVPRYLTETGVLDVLGPTDGDIALTALETVAKSNSPMASMLSRIVRDLQNSAGPGINFGNATVRAQLDGLATAGVLTSASVATLKAAATAAATVDYNQISNPGVWGQFRPNGKAAG